MAQFTAEQDLPEMTAGDDIVYNLTFTDPDTGNAIPLDNWTITATVKSNRSDGDGDAVIQKTVTTHSDPSNGKSRVRFESEDTVDLSGLYYYDIEVNMANGDDRTIAEGRAYFKPGVTD